MNRIRMRITASGRVQGVGFRPAVYRLACALQLAGWVGNGPQGVIIELEGPASTLAEFEARWLAALPPRAEVAEWQREPMPLQGEASFVIRESAPGGRLTLIPPDLALCERCRQELRTPGNRRHRYPFINCTDCGPRYSIAEQLPYDRAHTVMRQFPLCPACEAEYRDPADRRFHHQTITCPQCGPQLRYWAADGRELAGREPALALAVDCLRMGGILALKGLGGFHLLVDAANAAAVQRLRDFKQRPTKPFAVMMPDLHTLQRHCRLNADELAVLQSAASPLLLVDWVAPGLAPAVAPGQNRLGVMLPYTPLHALLLADFGGPLVATSGNRGGEPICTDEQQAVALFAGLVDGLLVHDRPIVRGVDDSVAQWAGGALRLLRHARGFVPQAWPQPVVSTPALAMGGHLKTTLAIDTGDALVMSAHIGDLDTAEARDLHAATAQDLQRLLAATPREVLVDAHPDYASRQTAQALGLPQRSVPHHVAHLAGCALEHGLPLPVAGCIWDGSGLGADGSLWGGETLQLQAGGWQRLGHFRPFRLIGGELAAREPRRALLGILLEVFGDLAWEHPLVLARFRPAELRVLRTVVARQLQCPLTSSVGRQFDALASLLDAACRPQFEGEAAMAVQRLAESSCAVAAGPVQVDEAGVFDWRPCWQALLQQQAAGVAPAHLARQFHATLAQVVLAYARRAEAAVWCLSGGCFQNRLLLEEAQAALRAQGIRALAPVCYPANDGGLSFGQLAVRRYGVLPD